MYIKTGKEIQITSFCYVCFASQNLGPRVNLMHVCLINGSCNEDVPYVSLLQEVYISVSLNVYLSVIAYLQYGKAQNTCEYGTSEVRICQGSTEEQQEISEGAGKIKKIGIGNHCKNPV